MPAAPICGSLPVVRRSCTRLVGRSWTPACLCGAAAAWMRGAAKRSEQEFAQPTFTQHHQQHQAGSEIHPGLDPHSHPRRQSRAWPTRLPAAVRHSHAHTHRHTRSGTREGLQWVQGRKEGERRTGRVDGTRRRWQTSGSSGVALLRQRTARRPAHCSRDPSDRRTDKKTCR